MSDRAESGELTRRRAARYARWFPRAWRDRYEEEFVAHLEAEFVERPHDLHRVTDIVLHGVGAHLTFGRNRQRTVVALVVMIMATLVTLTAVSASRYFAPLALSGSSELTSEGVGILTNGNQVNDLELFFNAPAHTQIHVTSIRVLPVPGFAVPRIVGAALVDHANHPYSILNTTSWPPRFPPGKMYDQQFKLQPVSNHTVNLGRHNTLWIGFRESTHRGAYVIDGLVLTYELHHVSHSVTLSKGALPDVIYVDPAPNSAGASARLSAQQGEAEAIAKAYISELTPAKEAFAVADAATLSSLAFNRSATLQDVRSIAARFFPRTSSGGVRNVAYFGGGSAHYRMTINDPAKGGAVTVCVTTQALNKSSGVSTGVGIVPC